ncbi:phosphoribosylamine--glycine ligase [Marinicella sp. W31]|uniref:phosphoribosylamine--glycine ligase n=1 Tax=Marinicella sp. W31 TaxID=3023713 RepID=UPI00375632F1
MKNTVLVIGSGGREHALAWRLAQSETVKYTYVAPGNAGTATEANMENVNLDIADFIQIENFCRQQNVDLVVVGPEQPLVAGIVDHLTEAGIACFGPSAAAAQLEGSKAFAKAFLKRYAIPTAAYEVFTEVEAACTYLQQQSFPQVIKADGLAAGKGVVIVQDIPQAEAVVKDMLADNKFGDAGSRIVIEEFLQGEEASFICMADGKDFISMATSQDHKARDDGDQGPNTGGMGAYSPAPVVTDTIHQRVVDEVIKPTLEGMQTEGMPFTGFLYAGLMIAADGTPKVLEFNVRFGDPETQPIMMRLKSPLDQLCLAAVKQELGTEAIEWDQRFALGVVMAEQGYPEAYQSGHAITGLESLEQWQDCKVFHAGTKVNDGKTVTAGGRVLCVCAVDESLQQAQQKAYAGLAKIQWGSAYFRQDIGAKGIRHLSES